MAPVDDLVEGGSAQTDLPQRLTQQAILVPSGHDHLRVQQTGNRESFSGENVQPSTRTVELIGHYRRHDPPSRELDPFWQLQHRPKCTFASVWWQGKQRAGQRPTSPANHGLTKAQVPMGRREDLIVRPPDFLTKQRGEGLVVDEDRQGSNLSLLVCQLWVPEPRAGRVPIGLREEPIAKLADSARNEHHRVAEVNPTYDPASIEAPAMACLCGQGHLASLAHLYVTCLHDFRTSQCIGNLCIVGDPAAAGCPVLHGWPQPRGRRALRRHRP